MQSGRFRVALATIPRLDDIQVAGIETEELADCVSGKLRIVVNRHGSADGSAFSQRIVQEFSSEEGDLMVDYSYHVRRSLSGTRTGNLVILFPRYGD
jgi:hypothetical protein